MQPLDRRSLLLGAAALAAPPRLAFAEGARPLASFGARGDGQSDDTAALQQALGSGQMLDGGGRTYGVSGPLTAESGFRGLANCTLRQLASEDRLRTLQISGASNFTLSGVEVIRGGQNDEALIQADMLLNAGIWVENGAGFHLDRVRVRGGGIGTGLVVAQSHGFKMTEPEVTGIHYKLTARPTDDMLQGIWVHRGADFELIHPMASDFGGQDSEGFSRDNNRAIAISGSSGFRLRDLEVSQCGQGLDVTGKEGNHDFEVLGGHAADCFSWGFKFANSAQRGKVSKALAERCGLAGFVVSGRSNLADPVPEDIEIADCEAIDCGMVGVNRTKFGFGVLKVRPDTDYPRRVHFIRCTAIDRRTPPGMKWGFLNDIPAPPGERNTVTDCTVQGAAITKYRGFGE